jgi:hypothetical protein
MSKYSDFKEWVDGVNALSDEERSALIKSTMLLPEFGGDEAITDQDESTRTPKFLEDAVLAIMYADHITAKMQAEIDALKAALADAELRECKQLALYSKAEATIGAALINIENDDDAECWLGNFMENTETPWHLYDDPEKFYRLYAMEFPLTVAQHRENVKQLNAVFDADMARLEGANDAN